MIKTNKKKLYELCKQKINHGKNLKNHKKTEKFIYKKDHFGKNLRITEIQSLAGLEQLKDLKNIPVINNINTRDNTILVIDDSTIILTKSFIKTESPDIFTLVFVSLKLFSIYCSVWEIKFWISAVEIVLIIAVSNNLSIS